jgi:rsbT co-antagonist protein RsbR
MFTLDPEHAKGASGLRKALAGELQHSISETYSIVWESWLMPLRDDRGEIVSVVGATLNISENKRIEKELLAKIEIIEKQQTVIRDLGIPIIEVWDRVLTVPLMGIVDSTRAATVMDQLLAKVVQNGSRYAILDLTGVETVDTKTASHILEVIRAIRLLGAEGVITGIRPSVAQAMVALGVDLSSIVTLANLRQGLKLCMQRMRSSA